MSLSNFLGDTTQIQIIDFFVGDAGNSYNISELSEETGITRMTLSKYIPELVQSKILEVNKSKKIKTYKLANNRLVELLVASAYAYSTIQGAEPIDRNVSVEKIRKELDMPEVSMETLLNGEGRRLVTLENDEYVIMERKAPQPLEAPASA
ncbi:MAG: winged helix-turn-helix domain-containing protein [Dehalobacter sp.]|nr:winged helix-turn-helix domain-containing protein [Dehalobacter sp.]